MKNLIAILGITLISTAIYAESKEVKKINKQVANCMEKNESNLGMKMCLGEGIEKAELALKGIVKKIHAANAEEKEILIRLKKSQEKWTAFADAECALVSTEMLGGSGESLSYAGCLLDLTNKRIDFLTERFIDNQE